MLMAPHGYLMLPGFAPAGEVELPAASRRALHYTSGKGPKTMLAVVWPFGSPARFANSGDTQTRCAQTLRAFSPVSAALLGHTTRPGKTT